MEDISLSEKLILNSVRITSRLDGSDQSFGTGFYYAFKNGSIALITNKHVVNGCNSIAAKLNTESHGFIEFNISLDNQNLINHPDDSIDLCAIRIDEVMSIAHSNGYKPSICTMSSDNIPTSEIWESLDGFEDVTMLGCPNGLFDSYNNAPIARTGMTATHPARSYNGKNEFVVDMACFPGSSGSPVFIYDRNGYFDKRQNAYMAAGRFLFVGILYAGPLINNNGEISLSTGFNFSISSTMHLGYVIKSDEMLVIENLA